MCQPVRRDRPHRLAFSAVDTFGPTPTAAAVRSLFQRALLVKWHNLLACEH